MALPAQPLINGFRYDWSSLTIRIMGQSLPNSFGKIAYSVEREGRAHVYGKGKDPIGQTRGRNKPTCSFTTPKGDWDHLCSLVPANTPLSEFFFDIVVSYEDEGKVITDKILGCTITKFEDDAEQGGDALMVSVEVLPTRVLPNGREFLSPWLLSIKASSTPSKRRTAPTFSPTSSAPRASASSS